MTEDERAEQVIRAGVPVEAKDWTCMGCGEVETIRVPGRPKGVHGTVVMLDNKGIGRPVDVWAHPTRKCAGSPLLKSLIGETSEAPEPADEGETIPATLMGRGKRGKALAEAEALTGAPASEREPEAVSN